ncbi:MAG: sigma-70 family RNA polymerase sigma factor [Candidatus Sericytochromatia bacterium]|nr:sigma-70 family RNA polymerase sigma factor [Candidatus Sericytochromatia bacterium]
MAREVIDLPESTLLPRARAGDGKAMEALFRRHQAAIHQLVYRMLHGAPETEDLVQDVFLKAFRGLPDFKGQSSFKTWLYQIATHHCLNHLARAERRFVHESLETPAEDPSATPLGERLPASSPGPEEAVAQAELRSRIEAAIAQLAPDYRAVLVLRDIQDLSYEEIAETLGLQLGTVKSRLARARKQVQAWLGDLRDETSRL